MDSMRETVASWTDFDGIMGVCLQRGSHVLCNALPKALSEKRVMAFAASVQEAILGYESVERRVDMIVLGFDGGTILCIGKGATVISFWLADTSVIPFAASTAQSFLRDFYDEIAAMGVRIGHVKNEHQEPAPKRAAPATVNLPKIGQPAAEKADMETWTSFRLELKQLLGKVVGSGQVERMIVRVLKSMNISDSDTKGVPASRFRELGVSTLLEIPNRAKQATLKAELQNILEKY